jgi:hypothetical protein
MKKLLFKIIALCLVVCSTIALFTACGAPAAKDDRETVPLGLYPQTQVTDFEETDEKTPLLDKNGNQVVDKDGVVMVNVKLVDKLLQLAGDPNVDATTWTSYKYYSQGKLSHCMRYKDVEYNGAKYRGVYIDSYRVYRWEERGTSNLYTWQDNNGYEKKVYDETSQMYASTGVYWFKYESVKWTVVKEEGGFKTLVSSLIIDSQPFQGTYGGNPEKNECYNNTNGAKDRNIKANNYEKSTIRTWLNETFYKLVFSAADMAKIQTVEVDNGATSTGYANNQFACSNTSDKVFLLSYKEVAEYFTNDAIRCKKTTDYAKCNGAYTFKLGLPTDGNGTWWLRSADSKITYQARVVNTSGIIVDTAAIVRTDKDHLPYAPYMDVAFTQYGVVPAIKIAA